MEEQHISIKAWAEDDRPRERLLHKGRKQLSDAELIAILLGSGSRKESAVSLAKRILASVDNNLDALGKLSVKELMQFRGVGEAKAVSLVAAMELGRRRKHESMVEKPRMVSSRAVFEYFYPKVADLPHEEFWVMLLNRANRAMGSFKVSQGGVSGTVADVRIIYKEAIQRLASSIILCHNHPSGNLKPSGADLELTDKLKAAGEVVDVPVLDHIIIAENDFFSFADEGIL